MQLIIFCKETTRRGHHQDFDRTIVIIAKIYLFQVRFSLELLPHCSNRITCREEGKLPTAETD